MKKKILLTSIVIVMILTTVCMALAGCGFKEDKVKDFTPPEMAIGATMPTWDNMASINKDMSAFQMLQVGMENFYNADYATIEYNGGVKVTVLGIPINQVVQSTKIRQGKGDANGNNANGATYFADNKSHSIAAKLYEKFIISPNKYERKTGKSIDYSSPGRKGKNGRLGKWTVGSWNEPDTYSNLQDLVDKNHNNPTILWMYDLQNDFITDKIDPIYDSETKTYRFVLKFDPKKSTEDYIEVMKAQLEGNAGMGVEGLTFLQLILEVVMWENGTIRSINVNEAYKMKMVTPVGKIDSNVNLKATQLFSYDANEAEYKIQDHIDAY